ncbi:hypothetical protein PSPO01_11263 [Paraphaeosphaeria sporulosa]
MFVLLKPRLTVVGVDLGTTYTSVSYYDTSRTGNIEDRIQIVSNWPAITYLGGGLKWGGAIPPNIQRHMWTKLELDAPRTGEAAKICQELLGSGYGSVAGVKRPVDIIADFLAQVLEHLIKNLNVHYTETLWQSFPLTLVVTYPAVWSDLAKALTLQAFSQAGFNEKNLRMPRKTITATEPEAAALYTIMCIRGTAQDKQLAVGDGFVVCDMGGGTVDLISYKVAGVDPTVLEEATIGTGDQCGGSFVERSFLRWLEEKLGEKDFREVAGGPAADISRTSLPARLSKMMQEFTGCAKSGFHGSDTEDYELRLPAPLNAIVCDTSHSIENGEILITSEDLKEMFSYSLQKIGELLLAQIKAAGQKGQVKVRFAFLVGGFAESQYIQMELQKLVINHGVHIIKPLHAWSAIARGAATKGLEQGGATPIKDRKCRRKHREQESYICYWLISEGQDLPTAAKVHGKVSMHSNFWPGEKRHASPLLLAADIDKAPRRSHVIAVYEVARLRVNLEQVPQRAFRKQNNSKKPYYELHYEIHISVQSGLEFSLWVDGKRYGAVAAEYA